MHDLVSKLLPIVGYLIHSAHFLYTSPLYPGTMYVKKAYIDNYSAEMEGVLGIFYELEKRTHKMHAVYTSY